MAVELPEFLPLEEAARRYRVSLEALRRAIENGKAKAVRTDGKILVAKEDAAVIAVQTQASNNGDELVSMSEAARRLGIDISYVAHWVEYGWLPVLGYGKRRAKLVSFNQAQALARLRENRGPHRGSRLIPRHQEMVT